MRGETAAACATGAGEDSIDVLENEDIGGTGKPPHPRLRRDFSPPCGEKVRRQEARGAARRDAAMCAQENAPRGGALG
jgi:hypothetical protein